MDALYVFRHSANGDFELRYSLRSIAQHAPYVRKVWVFGDKPDFLSADTSLIEQVPHAATARALGVKTPVTNFFLLLFLSSLIPDLASEYLFFCDDFFLLKDLPIEAARQDRHLEDMATVTVRGKGLWKDVLWRTYDLLKRLGYGGLNFETHVPAYLTRQRVIAAYTEFRAFVSTGRYSGMLGLTAILNHARKAEKMQLTNVLTDGSRCGFWGKAPALADVTARSANAAFLNFDDRAFGDAIRAFLTARFPEPSRYEKP